MPDTLTTIGLISDDDGGGARAALIETDGERVLELGPTLSREYSRDLKIWIQRAKKAALEGRDGAADIGKAAGELTLAQIGIVEDLLDEAGLKAKNIDVIGFHGPTIFHQPPTDASTIGRSWQLGDPQVLAEETAIDVVSDFRAADLAAGGFGGPLTPIYYQLLAAHLDPPAEGSVGIVDINRVTNITFVPPNGRPMELANFDCGPGLATLQEWRDVKTNDGRLRQKTKQSVDGYYCEETLQLLQLSPFFRRKPPKNASPADFSLRPALDLSLEDGIATLQALIAQSIARAAEFAATPVSEWIICGEGRTSQEILALLADASDAPVRAAEGVSWRADYLDAECCAYLGVRSLRKLPLTFPKTTRVPNPVCGGSFARGRR